MPLTRLKEWAAFLDTFIHARSKTPFAYASNDCCLFAADAIKEITGTDIAASFRGTYTDEASANAVIAANGGTVATLVANLATQFSMASVPPLTAQSGDLVALNGGAGIALGIVGCDGSVYGVGTDGLQRVALTTVVQAWRV